MDRIFIEGLTVATRIGIYAGERDATQALLLDIDLGFDNARAAASGNIDDTLDYTDIVAAIKDFAAQSDCGLLEQFAEDCCAMLRKKCRGIRSIDLRLDKPAAAKALGCRHVGVRIQRRFD